MISSITFGLALLPLFSAAFPVDPPTTASPDTVGDCTYWHVAAETDSCASIGEYWGLTDAQLMSYNPSLADGCKLTTDNSYCVERNYGIPTPSTTTTTLVTSTSQTPTPTPTTLLAMCEEEAGSYKDVCPRCLYRCEKETKYTSECFYSTFFSINGVQSQCWQHGGNDCRNQAVDAVCPRK